MINIERTLDNCSTWSKITPITNKEGINMRHKNYEEILRYIEDVDNHTIITCDAGLWRETCSVVVLLNKSNVKVVAKKYTALALKYYNDECANGVEIQCVGGWVKDKTPDFGKDSSFREAQPKYISGEWYPVVDEDGDPMVHIYDGRQFLEYPEATTGTPVNELKWVGESLGKLSFGMSVEELVEASKETPVTDEQIELLRLSLGTNVKERV